MICLQRYLFVMYYHNVAYIGEYLSFCNNHIVKWSMIYDGLVYTCHPKVYLSLL